MNKIAETLTGWRQHEAVGRIFPEVFQEKDVQAVPTLYIAGHELDRQAQLVRDHAGHDLVAAGGEVLVAAVEVLAGAGGLLADTGPLARIPHEPQRTQPPSPQGYGVRTRPQRGNCQERKLLGSFLPHGHCVGFPTRRFRM